MQFNWHVTSSLRRNDVMLVIFGYVKILLIQIKVEMTRNVSDLEKTSMMQIEKHPPFWI